MVYKFFDKKSSGNLPNQIISLKMNIVSMLLENSRD